MSPLRPRTTPSNFLLVSRPLWPSWPPSTTWRTPTLCRYWCDACLFRWCFSFSSSVCVCVCGGGRGCMCMRVCGVCACVCVCDVCVCVHLFSSFSRENLCEKLLCLQDQNMQTVNKNTRQYKTCTFSWKRNFVSSKDSLFALKNKTINLSTKLAVGFVSGLFFYFFHHFCFL